MRAHKLTHFCSASDPMSRPLHFTTPGFRPQIVDIAPDAEDPRSKRYEIFESEVFYVTCRSLPRL